MSPKLQGYIFDRLVCFGPKRLGTNLLISKFDKFENSFFRTIEQLLDEELLPKLNYDQKALKQNEDNIAKLQKVLDFNQISLKELNSALINGIDLASQAGPLMDEPMQGAVFIIEDFSLVEVEDTGDQKVNSGPFSGQVMSTIKNLCKKSFLNADPRIVEGMYKCSMQASPEVYGNVYSVIQKYRGRVVQEEVQDGTNFFLLDALIPLVEGFAFNEEIRKKSCGIAYP